MAEPHAQAHVLEPVFPWLMHWSISDERIGGFRSDSFALQTPAGLVLIDPVPLAASVQAGLENVVGIFLTHGNHQRSAWRLRDELDAPVYVPRSATDLDRAPDEWFDEETVLPGGLAGVKATGFDAACYLTFVHEAGTGVLFAGDLICQDADGSLRFPRQPGYFDLDGGKDDARRLLDLPLQVLCAAHAAPALEGCHDVLRRAIGG